MPGGLSPVDVARVSKRLESFAREVDGRAMAAALGKLGKEAAEDAERVTRGTLGDLSMSHWRRGNPIQIRTRSYVSNGVATVEPAGRAKGPMRVLEDGRQARSVGEGILRFRQSKKTGAFKTSHRIVKRNSGATAAKHTWSKAEAVMQATTRERMKVDMAVKFRKAFGG